MFLCHRNVSPASLWCSHTVSKSLAWSCDFISSASSHFSCLTPFLNIAIAIGKGMLSLLSPSHSFCRRRTPSTQSPSLQKKSMTTTLLVLSKCRPGNSFFKMSAMASGPLWDALSSGLSLPSTGPCFGTYLVRRSLTRQRGTFSIVPPFRTMSHSIQGHEVASFEAKASLTLSNSFLVSPSWRSSFRP